MTEGWDLAAVNRDDELLEQLRATTLGPATLPAAAEPVAGLLSALLQDVAAAPIAAPLTVLPVSAAGAAGRLLGRRAMGLAASAVLAVGFGAAAAATAAASPGTPFYGVRTAVSDVVAAVVHGGHRPDSDRTHQRSRPSVPATEQPAGTSAGSGAGPSRRQVGPPAAEPTKAAASAAAHPTARPTPTGRPTPSRTPQASQSPGSAGGHSSTSPSPTPTRSDDRGGPGTSSPTAGPSAPGTPTAAARGNGAGHSDENR